MPNLFDYMTGDITANRHGGAPTSVEAFESIKGKLPEARREVLEFIASRGDYGATVHEVAEHFGKGVNAVSGRISELLRDGDARRNGQKRNRASVVVAVKKVG